MRVAVAVLVLQAPPAGPYFTTALVAEMSVPKLTPTDVVVRSVRYGYRFSFASKAACPADGIAECQDRGHRHGDPPYPAHPALPQGSSVPPWLPANLLSRASFSRQTSD